MKRDSVPSNDLIGLATFATTCTVAMFVYHQGMFSNAELRALGLSTLAGLSTSIGATLAVIRKPDDATLAFLLGLALGVMATLSIIELWIKNGLEHGFGSVSLAVGAGVLLYKLMQPYFPEFQLPESSNQTDVSDDTAASMKAASKDVKKRTVKSASEPDSPHTSDKRVSPISPSTGSTIPASELFRLGLLMAFTMTLHNLPEGCAVAFSSYTGLGWVMAVAIALHNIPEGIIVAAPIYAATNSRFQALSIATLSGLSEPLGALLALLFVKPFLTPLLLQVIMAFMGGIMLAVCGLELYPEARKCKNDTRAWQGIALGSFLMIVTLAADV